MFDLESLNIDLRSVTEQGITCSWTLGDDYFQSLSDAAISSGEVSAGASIRKTSAGAFSLTLTVNGVVNVPCAVCLDPVEQSIGGSSTSGVKLGTTDSDDGDTITVGGDTALLRLAWPLYETIVLAVPSRPVHAPGKCNTAMTEKLHELSASSQGESTEQSIDPRWRALITSQNSPNNNGTS